MTERNVVVVAEPGKVRDEVVAGVAEHLSYEVYDLDRALEAMFGLSRVEALEQREVDFRCAEERLIQKHLGEPSGLAVAVSPTAVFAKPSRVTLDRAGNVISLVRVPGVRFRYTVELKDEMTLSEVTREVLVQNQAANQTLQPKLMLTRDIPGIRVMEVARSPRSVSGGLITWTLRQILDEVEEQTGISPVVICGRKRTAEIARARNVTMYLCRTLTKLSLAEIGGHLGGRDHTTVIHGVERVKELLLRRDRAVTGMVESIQLALEQAQGTPEWVVEILDPNPENDQERRAYPWFRVTYSRQDGTTFCAEHPMTLRRV